MLFLNAWISSLLIKLIFLALKGHFLSICYILVNRGDFNEKHVSIFHFNTCQSIYVLVNIFIRVFHGKSKMLDFMANFIIFLIFSFASITFQASVLYCMYSFIIALYLCCTKKLFLASKQPSSLLGMQQFTCNLLYGHFCGSIYNKIKKQ